ncbi:RNA helicase [Candidatus Gracilibacteria bacterium]|nr:MAG: RNA helicase [Candidatus Gracilibacteria bacterium]
MTDTTNTLFSDLGLSKGLLKAIETKGYTKPSPIQAGVIPLLLNSKKDIIGQANTGTGKTASFALPLIDMIEKSDSGVQAIILAPTRELAIQISDEIKSFLTEKRLNTAIIYGGQSYFAEEKMLRNEPKIVIGTPGRVKDHIKKGRLSLDSIKYFVLDEADEMLNVGFREEIEEIMEGAPKNRRTLLFSATLPRAIMNIVKTYMGEYDMVSVKSGNVTNELIQQTYFEVQPRNKFEVLCRVIDTEPDFYGIVFCRTKKDVDEVVDNLISRGYSAEGVHGDVEQKGREKILARFKRGGVKVLVATDVAARGIDINDLTHVVNFSLPENPEVYTHRIGRTGRAGKEGIAISLVSRGDMRLLMGVERFTKNRIKKGVLPGVGEIIKLKKQKLIKELEFISEHEDLTDFSDISDKILEENNPKDVISALLKKFYKESFNEESYYDIQETNFSTKGGGRRGGANSNGEVRLFIARGREDNMGPKDIINFITKDNSVKESSINDLQMLDKFSFVNVNLRDAEEIMADFKQKDRRRPVVVQAKERNNDDRGSDKRGGSRGSYSRDNRGRSKSSYSSDRRGNRRSS